MTLLPKTPLVVTFEDIPSLLPYIPADDRETWVQVGMGLKAEFGDDAFGEFDTWSASDKTYNAITCQQVWKSIKGTGVGIATVVKLALDNGWRPEKKEMTAEDKARLKQEAEERRARILKKAEEDDRLRQKMQSEVAAACEIIWRQHCRPAGYSPYLNRKQVKPYGIGFLKSSVLLVVDFSEQERAYVLTGADLKKFFAELPSPCPDTISFRLMKKKGVVIPIIDHDNFMWGLQYINEQGTKKFPKFCKKSGCFHVLGEVSGESTVIAFAEGYATAASFYEAVNYPTVVTFDVGNMVVVGKSFHEKYPSALKVFAGDDDKEKESNAGRKKAEQVATECGGLAIFPEFERVGEVAKI